MTATTVVVRTIDAEYIAGGTVEGTVTFFVDQMDPRLSLAAKVVITIMGVEHISCRANSSPTSGVVNTARTISHEKASQHVFWSCTPLVLDGAIGAGIHTWSFPVVLPKDLPPSMTMERPPEENMWNVSYGATASFSFGERDPILSTSAEVEFLIWKHPLPYLTTPPVTVGPENTPDSIDTRGRTKRGSASLGFRLNQTTFGRGEVIRVSVACLNNDPMVSHIESVTIEFVQEAILSTTTSTTDSSSVAIVHHEEVLAREMIEGEEDVVQSGLLSETKCKIGVVADMFSSAPRLRALPHSSSSSTHTQTRKIRSMLNSGKGAHFAVGVPMETLDTVTSGGENQDSIKTPGYLKLLSSLHHFVRVTIRAEETYGSSSQVLTMQHAVRVLHHLTGSEEEPTLAVAVTDVPFSYAPADYLRGVVVGHDSYPLPMAHGYPGM